MGIPLSSSAPSGRFFFGLARCIPILTIPCPAEAVMPPIRDDWESLSIRAKLVQTEDPTVWGHTIQETPKQKRRAQSKLFCSSEPQVAKNGSVASHCAYWSTRLVSSVTLVCVGTLNNSQVSYCKNSSFSPNTCLSLS